MLSISVIVCWKMSMIVVTGLIHVIYSRIFSSRRQTIQKSKIIWLNLSWCDGWSSFFKISFFACPMSYVAFCSSSCQQNNVHYIICVMCWCSTIFMVLVGYNASKPHSVFFEDGGRNSWTETSRYKLILQHPYTETNHISQWLTKMSLPNIYKTIIVTFHKDHLNP